VPQWKCCCPFPFARIPRTGGPNLEEGFVREADKLWRFSPEGFKVDTNRSKSVLEERCKRLEKDLKDSNYIYSKSAKKIARQELKERKKLIESAKE